ncbi:helix-turn-helix domain-containing protein, partial [Colwellia sp. BRX8-3]
MKSLRLEKRWSQEQLAQLSDLNVRTIQRVEKGESIGTETLKSLAAVFEISTDELICAINNEKNLQTEG